MKKKRKRTDKAKQKQLGVAYGTACGRLRKSILFNLVQKLDLDICFRCGDKILLEKNLSIEHKVPWLHSEDPVKLFYDLENIAFSHLKCNVKEARCLTKKEHGTRASYKRGCRCESCRKANSTMQANVRKRRKERTGFSRSLTERKPTARPTG